MNIKKSFLEEKKHVIKILILVLNFLLFLGYLTTCSTSRTATNRVDKLSKKVDSLEKLQMERLHLIELQSSPSKIDSIISYKLQQQNLVKKELQQLRQSINSINK